MTSTTDTRADVINQAFTEWDRAEGPLLQTRAHHVNSVLEEHGHAPLASGELDNVHARITDDAIRPTD